MTKLSMKEAIFNRRMLICIFTGFSSGLPLFVLYQLVPGWLRDEGVSLAEIGLFSLIGIPYVCKFVWSPALDRFSFPFLGRRRGWMLVTQITLLVSIAAFGFIDPTMNIWSVAYLAAAVAFFSASQDIVIDAYRRELLSDQELGLGNSLNVQAYRVSGLIPGSLAFILAVECVQYYIPYRSGGLDDVIADALGVALFYLLTLNSSFRALFYRKTHD